MKFLVNPISYDLAVLLLGIYLEKKALIKKALHPNVHSSTIYTSQDMETAQVPINRWLV